MTSASFAYWMQGFFEIQNPTEITAEQTQIIKNHLNLVFKHEIDPAMGDQKHQDELNEIHNKKPIVKSETNLNFPVPNKFHNPDNDLMRC